MPELPDLIAAAHDEMRGRLAAVSPDDWDRPTPCTDWTVDGLVRHIVYGEAMTPLLLDGQTAEGALAETEKLPREELLDAWERASGAAEAALRAPGALDGMVNHRVMGEIPAVQLGVARMVDIVVHAWDLAAALGASRDLDPALVKETLGFVEPFRELIPRSVFADEIEAAPAADEQARLLAILGRDPAWQPS